MKKTIAILAGLLLASSAFAVENVGIVRNELGSGTPGANGWERAIQVGPDSTYLHAPQYMPGFPTAATIWPRVINVKCTGDKVHPRAHSQRRDVTTVTKCDGYNWSPALGRGEYLFINPSVVEVVQPVPPVIITKEVIKEVIKEVPVIVLKEVPVKPKKE